MKFVTRFRKTVFICVVIFAGTTAIGAEQLTLRISTPVDGVDVPVCAEIKLPPSLTEVTCEQIVVQLKQTDTVRDRCGLPRLRTIICYCKMFLSCFRFCREAGDP